MRERESWREGEKIKKQREEGQMERESVCVWGRERDLKGLKEQRKFSKRMEREEKLGSTERDASTREEQFTGRWVK